MLKCDIYYLLQQKLILKVGYHKTYNEVFEDVNSLLTTFDCDDRKILLNNPNELLKELISYYKFEKEFNELFN